MSDTGQKPVRTPREAREKPAPKKEATVAPSNPKTAQQAVDALIEAISVPRANIAEITITVTGRVRVITRDRAAFQAATVRPLAEEPSA